MPRITNLEFVTEEQRGNYHMVRTCHGLEYRTSAQGARYLVNDKDALVTSTKKRPVLSHSGNSWVWRETGKV